VERARLHAEPATIRTYEHDMTAYVLDDLGAHKLADIRPDDLQALVDRLVGEERSGSKVRNVLVPLQALYRRHRRDVPVDPTEGLDLPAPSEARQRAAAPAEAFALLGALPDDERALWATAFLAGLRRGELRALRISDVDYPAVTTIRVERGWDDEEGPIEPKSRKGRRTVPVASELRR
jgi:integrase